MTLIGGFFGLELPPPPPRGLAVHWGMPADPGLTFVNGRSALAALISYQRPVRVWLPAFICRSVAEAVLFTGTPLHYFPITEDLEPDVTFLTSAVSKGDMVLNVNYFGRPPGARFLNFVRGQPGVVFVEDAAQSLDTGQAAWGHWRLYSTRKLVGVPDGGFLVPSPDFSPSMQMHDLGKAEAALLRFEDENDVINASWHNANQARESRESVTQQRMSRLSRELLSRFDPDTMISRRKSNYNVLATILAPVMLLRQGAPTFAPFGFPIRLAADVRPTVRQALIENGVFPAIHWDHLPSPATFTIAHRLAAELLTLPCDHRYGSADMERIGDIVLRVMQPE